MSLEIPGNALEFDLAYGTEEKCRRALQEMRWPDGFSCPHCGHDRAYELRCRAALECTSCGRQISLLAGTIFHGSKLTLVQLFRMVYMIVAEKSGTNAMAIHRQIGVSHRTALLWVRKVRSIMDRRPRTRISGTVEVDESVIGGKPQGTQGREIGPHQARVVVLAQDKGEEGMGRVRLEPIERATTEELGAVIRKHVELGSTLRTDGWRSYPKAARGYDHQPHNVKKSGLKAHEGLPLVHLVSSLLKRFISGVLHGSWRRAWLPLLLAEFEFRINRRRSRKRPLLFHRVMELGIRRRPLTREAFAELGSILSCA